MSTVRIYKSMQDGVSQGSTRSDLDINEITEIQKKIKHLHQRIALRYRQKGIYARMITYYRKQIIIKTKEKDKLAKKLARLNKPYKKLLRKQRKKMKLEMEKHLLNLQYLKKLSEVTKGALKVYKKEKKAYKRKFKAVKALYLTKNTALKKLKRKIRRTDGKYKDAIEVIEDLKTKLKLAKERRKSLSLKDLKKKMQLNKERLATLLKYQVHETVIYQVLPDAKVTGFQKQKTVVPISNPQLDLLYDISKKSNIQTKRMRRVRKRMSSSFSTDTSMSKTSALKASIRQSEPIFKRGHVVLEPLPIGDKLHDKSRRLAHRFTKRVADRTKKSKHSSSPPGDHRTPTTISADSDDTGLELKPKKKRVTLNIEGDEPLIVPERKSSQSHADTSGREPISEEEARRLRKIYDDKYFEKLAGRHSPKIRRQLREARLKKKMELEKKLLEEEEEKIKKAMEFQNKRDLRASSIDSSKSNHEVKMAMKSTYKMADIIPHNIQIIDEDILQLAGKRKAQPIKNMPKKPERKLKTNNILEYLKSIKTIGPIGGTSKVARRSKIKRSSRKSVDKPEENDTDQQATEEEVPKEEISTKNVRKKKASFTLSELDEPIFDDILERRRIKSTGLNFKKIEGLAYNNNSMYQKFLTLKKNKFLEQERGSMRSIGSTGKRTSVTDSKQKTRESLEFRKVIPTILKQEQKIQPAPVAALTKSKSSRRAKGKSRISPTTQQESISEVAPHQKDVSMKTVMETSKHVYYEPSKIVLSHSAPNIQVKKELPPPVVEYSPEVPKVEYDENYFQRLFRAHSTLIKKKLRQERMKKLELQKKMQKLQILQVDEDDSIEKTRKSMASQRSGSYDSVSIMQKATASTYRMPDVIPHDIPVVDEDIIELASKTRRQTMKDVLSGKFEGNSDSEGHPVGKSRFHLKKKSKFLKKKRSKKSETPKRTDSEVSEHIINVMNLQVGSISQPDDKLSNDATFDDSSKVDETEESEAPRLSGRRIAGLAYGHNSMYNKYINEKIRISFEEKQASLPAVETRQSTKSRRSTKKKSLEILSHRRRSRKSIKRRNKKFLVIQTSPIHLKEISGRESEKREIALQELYETQSQSPDKTAVRKIHSEPKLEKSIKNGVKSKSLPDVCYRPPEVHIVCSACGMTNLTPGGPCCSRISKTK